MRGRKKGKLSDEDLRGEGLARKELIAGEQRVKGDLHENDSRVAKMYLKSKSKKGSSIRFQRFAIVDSFAFLNFRIGVIRLYLETKDHLV